MAYINGPAYDEARTGRGGKKKYGDTDISALWRELTGKDQANGWGNDIDQDYYDSIRRTIAGTPEAVAWANRNQNPDPTPDPTPTGGGGPNIFDDPATRRWEGATNDAANRLMTPMNNPDFQPYVDYMRKYFAQLQQPGHTASEQDLLQTQALDPMERDRTAAKQRLTQQFANRGVQGGVVERAGMDLDRQFNEMRTKSQANFASNEIAMNQQRQGQAAQVGAALSQAQQAAAMNDEGRMMQALQLMFQIPQYADTRMTLANNVLQPMNTGNLMSLLQQYQQTSQGQENYNQGQNQQYLNELIQLLYKSFGM